jgi:hypothetical protein
MMKMPKFAVYYVSPPNEFYHLGASIVGYDLRMRKPSEMTQQLQTQLDYDSSWNKDTRSIGFHCTIGCSLDFNYTRLSAIEQEIEDLLACFNPDHPFLLHQKPQPIVFTGQGPYGVLLRYDANTYLQILHTLITARMQPFGTNSRFLQSYLENPEQYLQYPHRARKVLKFYYYPWILDEYGPHFTLLNPYMGKDRSTIEHVFTERFHPFQQIQVTPHQRSIESSIVKTYHKLAITRW